MMSDNLVVHINSQVNVAFFYHYGKHGKILPNNIALSTVS